MCDSLFWFLTISWILRWRYTFSCASDIENRIATNLNIRPLTWSKTIISSKQVCKTFTSLLYNMFVCGNITKPHITSLRLIFELFSDFSISIFRKLFEKFGATLSTLSQVTTFRSHMMSGILADLVGSIIRKINGSISGTVPKLNFGGNPRSARKVNLGHYA